MITTNQIHWVAALLEGEGYFGFNNNSPRIQVAMTDLDIVEKFRRIVDPTKRISPHIDTTGVRKPRYTFTLTGNLAVQWMMTIYPLMGIRRRAKIQEILAFWRTHDRKRNMVGRPRTPKGLKRVQLAVRLRNLGYSGNQLKLAKLLSMQGLSDEEIQARLEELKLQGIC